MNRLLIPLLWIASSLVAAAQIVSPSINYQGRAVDGNGTAVTGQHQITMAIYGTQTGGSPLFSETHPTVNFDRTGAFTVVIGGATTGGIPANISFDQPRWIGVTISGFNGGNEMPRLRLYGSPYSFVSNRAFIADSSRASFRSANALLADSAIAANRSQTALRSTIADGLQTPALLATTGSNPTLTVTGAGTVEALKVEGGLFVQGGRYAIVSKGIDSTAGHYVPGQIIGSANAPDAGSLYRDNVPVAWGQIDADGSLISDFGLSRVNHTPNGPGVYEIVLDNPVAVIGNVPQYSIVVTPSMGSGQTGASPVFGGWNYLVDSVTKLRRGDAFEVNIRNLESGVDNRFSVVVFGRPAN